MAVHGIRGKHKSSRRDNRGLYQLIRELMRSRQTEVSNIQTGLTKLWYSYCALIHISSHISIHEKSNVDSLSIILWFFTHTWTVKSHYQAVSNLFHTCVFSVLYVCGAQTSFRGGFELFSESIISNVAKIFPNIAMSQNNCFGCWHAPRLWQDEWKVYDHFKAKLQIKDFKGDVDKYISLLW